MMIKFIKWLFDHHHDWRLTINHNRETTRYCEACDTEEVFKGDKWERMLSNKNGDDK